MDSRWSDQDLETGYKVYNEWAGMLFKLLHCQECFRVFSKDETGCITAEEMKWVTRVEMIVVWQTRDPVETLIGSYTTYFLF